MIITEPAEYRVLIMDMPQGLRPRERLLQEGPQHLSEIELLAIMLRSGSVSVSAIDLATAILKHCDGKLGRLLDLSVEELAAFKGVGPAKTAQIMAALELGRRVAMAAAWDQPVIKSPENAAALVMEQLRHLDREHFGVLLLNTKNQVLDRAMVSVGTLNSSAVHPREVFKSAIRRSAANIILYHNHPSGDPTPSAEDIAVTKRLTEAGEILGIGVLDHLIIGDNRFTSFKAKGLI